MKRLSRYGIEQIAARVIRAYKALPELARKAIQSVDPELLTIGLLQLTLEYLPLSPDGTVLGLTSYEPVGVAVYQKDRFSELYMLDGSTVLVDSNVKADPTRRGRLNFTIIHEASHHILKLLYPSEYGITQKTHYYRATPHIRQTPITDWEEWQANTLAAAILLPPELVRAGMETVGLGERMEMLNRVFRPAQYERFCQLAELLGVSKFALVIRMKQLNLLDKDYLGRPYDLIDIWVDEDDI